MVSKETARTFFKTKLKSFLEQKRAHLSWGLSENLKTLPLIWKKNTLVASFKALREEPSLQAFEQHIDAICHFVYPTVERKTLPPQMKFASRENGREVTGRDIDVFLVPGVAFDKQGYRLGRGGGFYDRYLQDCKGLKIGIAFSCQVSKAALPRESHDIPMDMLITENMCLEV